MLSGGNFRVLVGGPIPERLEGGNGVDILIGLAGADTLDGGACSDILLGGHGANSLMGGAGRDALWGGRDADLFRFAPEDAAQPEADVVVDFYRPMATRSTFQLSETPTPGCRESRASISWEM